MTQEELDQILVKKLPAYKSVGTVFLESLSGVVAADKTILDVGCGRRTFGEEVYLQAGRRIGLDLDSYAKENRAMDQVHIISSNDSWPIEAGSVDIVTAQWVMEHVADPDHFIHEISRVLKPGGVFIGMTTNAPSLFVSLTRLFPTRIKSLLRYFLLGYAVDETFKTEYRLNSESELRVLVKRHGLLVDEITYISCFDYFRFTKITAYLAIYAWYILRVFKKRSIHMTVLIRKSLHP